MRTHTHFALRPSVFLLLLLTGLLVLPASLPSVLPSAMADLVEDTEHNFLLETPFGWSRLPYDGAWEKLGIVLGFVRELTTLKNGEPAKGEGGQLHLSITPAPADKSLDELARDPEVQGFMMKAFDEDPAKWPKIEIVSTEDSQTGLAMRVLTAEGEAPNLKLKKAPVRAVMLVTVAKKKLFRLRMYAWRSEFDAEGLKGDLDQIEMNFVILDPKDDPEDTEGERPPPSTEDEEEDVSAEDKGDRDEEKVLENKLVGWKMVKPVGIKSFEWDKEAQPDAVAWFQDNTQYGSYMLILYVIPRGRMKDGRQLPDQNIKEWGLDKWWGQFSVDHPDGPIRVWRFPKRPKQFLLLPEFDSEKEIFTEPKERPKDPTEIKGSELEKKWKAAEKIKGMKMGEEKLIESYRAVLGGNRARSGREIVIRYLWGTPRLTCMLVVSFSREGHKKWGEQVQKLLDSVEMTGRP